MVLWEDLSGTRLNPRESGDWEQLLIPCQSLAELRQVCTKVDASQRAFSRWGSEANHWDELGSPRHAGEVLWFCEGKNVFFLSHQCIGKQSGRVKTIFSLPV